MTGTIKNVSDKGYGFIVASDGNEYFFHRSALKNADHESLRQGQKVTSFDAGQGPKGPRAENIVVE